MTNENLELSIKRSFESIVPDNSRKEEIYNKLILEMSNQKAAKPSFFSKFIEKLPRIMPYAVACACLLLVIGITFSGGFDNVLSKNSAETAAYSLETINESTSYAADAELIEDRMLETETEIPEAANECIADDCEAIISEKFYVLQNNGSFIAYEFSLNEYDPLIIWQQYQELNSVLENIKLLDFEFDELNNIITLNFSEEIYELIKKDEGYNLLISVGETFKYFYPEYRFSVKANSELLIIDGKQVDFKSHLYVTSEN